MVLGRVQERTQNMEKLKCELALQLQLIQQQQQGGAAPGPSGHMQPGGMMPHYMPGAPTSAQFTSQCMLPLSRCLFSCRFRLELKLQYGCAGPGTGLAMGSGGAMGMGQHFSGMMHPMQMQGVQMQGMQMQGMHSMGYVPQQMSTAAAPLQSGETAAAHSSAGTSQVRLWPHSMLSHVPVDSVRVGAPGSFQVNAKQVNAKGAAHYGLKEIWKPAQHPNALQMIAGRLALRQSAEHSKRKPVFCAKYMRLEDAL